MKKSILFITAIFSIAVLFSSCKEAKKDEVKIENHEHNANEEKVSSEDVYQCPMDCEEGKTYAEAGSCPVCKMDLKKQTNNSKQAQNCNCKKGEDCTCDSGKCKCNAKVSDQTSCSKCEPGSCTCKGKVEATAVKESCGGKCKPGACLCKA